MTYHPPPADHWLNKAACLDQKPNPCQHCTVRHVCTALHGHQVGGAQAARFLTEVA